MYEMSMTQIREFMKDNYGGYRKLLDSKREHWKNAIGREFDKDGRLILSERKIEATIEDYYKATHRGRSTMCTWFHPAITQELLNRKLITSPQARVLSMYSSWLSQLVTVGAVSLGANISASHPVDVTRVENNRLPHPSEALRAVFGDPETEPASEPVPEPFAERITLELELENLKLYLLIYSGGNAPVKVKWLSILEAAQKSWCQYTEYGRIYTVWAELEKYYRKHNLNLSSSRALREAKENRANYGEYSLWVRTDGWLKEMGARKPEQIILSINPLDHYVMAGSGDASSGYNRAPEDLLDSRYNPTLFRTCWGVSFYEKAYNPFAKPEQDIAVRREGEYGYPDTLLAFGAVREKGVLYVRNNQLPVKLDMGTDLEPDELELYGVTHRCHAYLVNDLNKVYFDNMYPSILTGLRDQIKDTLGDSYMKREDFIKLSKEQGTVGEHEDDDIYAIKWDVENAEPFYSCSEEDDSIFLDSAAMDLRNEVMYLFREHTICKSVRIKIGYDSGHDLSPLENCGALEGYSKYVGRCRECGEPLYADEDYLNLGGNYFCGASCAEDSGWGRCCTCDMWVRENDSIFDAYYENHYCSQDCAESNRVHECAHCGTWTSGGGTYEAENRAGYYCDGDCVANDGIYECFCGSFTENETEICEICNTCEQEVEETELDDEAI